MECLESRLTLQYHGIEKGASFPNPKRPYGLSKILEIRELLGVAADLSVTPVGLSAAESAVRALKSFNDTGEISEVVTPLSDWDGSSLDEALIDRFVKTRHSVRNFDRERDVNPSLIQKIVALASSTPSVCNRRSYRAHYFDDSDRMSQVLALQNGNGGFSHTVQGLLVVTVRRSSFTGVGERNQRWVDGGLFAMSIVWLCHAHGLGTCFLNWSQTNSVTDKLRSVAGISAAEDVIVLIAVGYPAQGHRVARSLPRPETDTFVWHTARAQTR